MKRLLSALFLSAAVVLPMPSFAQVLGPLPVIDPAAIVQITQQVTQTLNLLQQAQRTVAQGEQNLQILRTAGGLTNIGARISAVTNVLQQAKSLCMSARVGRVPPAACRVEANSANAQVSQLGSEMAQVQGLQRTVGGVSGGLAAQQATAAGIVEMATQLVEMRQAQNAKAQQDVIDANTFNAATASGPISVRDPFAP